MSQLNPTWLTVMAEADLDQIEHHVSREVAKAIRDDIEYLGLRLANADLSQPILGSNPPSYPIQIGNHYIAVCSFDFELPAIWVMFIVTKADLPVRLAELAAQAE